jgi:hypothetical protein
MLASGPLIPFDILNGVSYPKHHMQIYGISAPTSQ